MSIGATWDHSGGTDAKGRQKRRGEYTGCGGLGHRMPRPGWARYDLRSDVRANDDSPLPRGRVQRMAMRVERGAVGVV
jgi:hypothetical protein